MALRDQAISRGASILVFDPSEIHELPEYNVRNMDSPETIAYIRGMADVIKSEGVAAFPPITIRRAENGEIAVMAGWCRRRAHVLAISEGADVKGIQCIDAGKKSKEEITLDILTSNSGLPLSAMERAKAVKKLQAFLWSPADIAKKTGWSVSTVNNLITLHDSPDAIIDMVNSGQVSATLATKLVREKGSEAAQKELEGAIETSAKAGKKKATQKDLQSVAEAKINWKKVGPKLYRLAAAIYETPIMDKGKLQDRIAAMGEILADIETQSPELREG